MLKRILKSHHPYEVGIHKYLTTGGLASHPHNHCAPLYEVLQSPYDEDVVLLVLPLYRKFHSPSFVTVGEIVEFFRQIFEASYRSFSFTSLLLTIRDWQGLRFIHQCGVAHR